jgi:hypothetical protein
MVMVAARRDVSVTSVKVANHAVCARYHGREIHPLKEESLSSAGLSADPKEYRSRLAEESDEQLDAWMIELMRDMSIRRGVLTVLEHVREATGLDDNGIERIFTAGGGAPAIVGRTAEGQLMVPAISLHHLVPGLRAQSARAREQEIEFLVAGFHEVVYI